MSKWISVKKQPEPNKDGLYRCKGHWLNSDCVEIEDNVSFYGEWDIANNFVLTHWMPMSGHKEV